MKILRAKNITEAIAMQQETNGYYLAGGTFTMVEVNADRFHPAALIDLSLCKELYGIIEDDSCVSVGAMTTFTQIEKDPLLQRLFPAVAKAAAEVGGPQVRNRGTISGNICAASPAADMAPPLLALNAAAVAVGAGGSREIPISEFFLAPKKSCLQAGEIVTRIILPKRNYNSAFCKIGKRNALAVSSANMAVAGVFNGAVFEKLNIAVGSCAPTPRLCPKTAESLVGVQLSEDVLSAAKAMLMQEIAPIDDRWATAEYRKLVTQNMLEQLICDLTKGENA